MAVKIPLKMSDGTMVRTIEELREHFDLEAVLGYYSSGRLAEWLEERYYNEEVEKVKTLKTSSKKFNKNLCEILGVDYSEKTNEKLDIKEIKSKNKHYKLLKKYTTDEKILSMAGDIIFTQEELDNLGYRIDDWQEEDDKGNKEVYLCGEHFVIPRYIGNVTYKGINHPKVEFADSKIISSSDDDPIETGIDFQDVDFSFDDFVTKYAEYGFDGIGRFFCSELENNPDLAINTIRISAEKGSVDAWMALGWCYEQGFGVEKDNEEALKWYQKAAAQGSVDKMTELCIETLKLKIDHEKMLQEDRKLPPDDYSAANVAFFPK